VLAMVGEVGEIAEIVQWTDDNKIGELLASGGRERLAEELADVLIYLIRVADRSGVDLESGVRAKLAANGLKYPVERARGSAKKYDELGS
jgi:dCTP diphosphatase